MQIDIITVKEARDLLFNDLPFMVYAKRASLNSNYRYQQMGVVIANKSTILATGYNQIRYKRFGSKFCKWDESLHAEIACMTKIDKDKLRRSEVYIYRESKIGMPANARPCPNCFEALKWAKVKRIYYTIDCFESHYWSSIIL